MGVMLKIRVWGLSLGTKCTLTLLTNKSLEVIKPVPD